MKKISITLPDVEVQLIRFVSKDAYEDFNFLDNRKTEVVSSEFEEISKLQAQIPIALFRQKDGSYIHIKQKQPGTEG
ncbi:MAG: hypothetical protein QM762_24840 [Chryseolinea sp.]